MPARDLASDFQPLHHLTAGSFAGSGSSNGTAILLAPWRAAIIQINVWTSAATLTVNLQSSADGSSGWTTEKTGTISTTGTSHNVYVEPEDVSNPYVRVQIVRTDTWAGSMNAVVVGRLDGVIPTTTFVIDSRS